jgi:hypothetical protein
MPLPTTAVLTYRAIPTNAAPAALKAAMESVVLYSSAATDPVLKGLFDSVVFSDATDLTVQRVITLTLGSGFFVLFPTADSWNGAFQDLYGRTLALALSTPVQPSAVIF